MKYLLLLCLTACATLPHVEPQTRDSTQQAQTTVTVQSYCDGQGGRGTGVIISERHVLTAHHVVRCAKIPRVYVTLSNGDRHRVYVTRENTTQDIAKLEISHAGRFGLDIAPPKLEPAYYPDENDAACVHVNDGMECGFRLSPNTLALRLRPGDSGSPVYDNDYLVGLVTRDHPRKNLTIITLITEDWLEGT